MKYLLLLFSLFFLYSAGTGLLEGEVKRLLSRVDFGSIVYSGEGFFFWVEIAWRLTIAYAFYALFSGKKLGGK